MCAAKCQCIVVEMKAIRENLLVDIPIADCGKGQRSVGSSRNMNCCYCSHKVQGRACAAVISSLVAETSGTQEQQNNAIKVDNDDYSAG